MKKLVPILFLSMMLILGTAFSASAIPMKLHIGTAIGDDDGWTGVFSQLQIFANTTTTQYGDPNLGSLPQIGDTFSDVGNLSISSLIPDTAEDEGLNAFYEITATWSALTGSIVSQTVTSYIPSGTTTPLPGYFQITTYDPGPGINFYLDSDVDHEYAPTVAAADDSGFGLDGDGSATLVGIIQVTGGTGINLFDATTGLFVSGTSIIDGVFISMADDFWYTAAGLDMYDNYFMKFGWSVIGDIDQNTDNVVVTPVMIGSTLFTVDSDHDGSIDFAVIPEPATMLLLGSGLLGLAGIGRKKKFFKKD